MSGFYWFVTIQKQGIMVSNLSGIQNIDRLQIGLVPPSKNQTTPVSGSPLKLHGEIESPLREM